MMELTNANLSDFCLYQSSWSQQLKNAMTVNGGELEGATFQDYLMHFCTFGVKFFFALAPPPGYGSGIFGKRMVSIFHALIQKMNENN